MKVQKKMANREQYLDLFNSMITNIERKIRLQTIILFGSRARGDAHQYSDYDLVIIADFEEPYAKRRDWVVRLTPDVSVDLFCFTPDEFEQLFSDLNLTAIDAIGEGIVLVGNEFVAPFKERYAWMELHGMRKTDCLIIPPES